MPLILTRNGLCRTVRAHGVIVEQTVVWPGLVGVLLRGQQRLVRSPDGAPLVRATWLEGDRVRLEPLVEGMGFDEVWPERPWTRLLPDGRELNLELVPRAHGMRGEDNAGGDLALLTLVLALSVAVAQFAFLADLITGAAGGEGTPSYEVTPEYIARLLEQDYEGEEDGLQERAERPEYQEQAPSFYLPSGNEGPMSRTGGGAVAGDEVRRSEKREAGSTAPPAPPDPAIAPESTPLADAGQLPSQSAPDDQTGEDESSPDPVERFVGWGFRDWFDVRDARDSVNDNLRRELDLVRKRLRIDPNDPVAVTTLGYYAYLSENYTLGEDAFNRFVTMYPDEPAGYNNMALIYKRTGEYEKEEALYRKALELSPLDDHVLNNLAVCLAHQGRFDEALEIMEQLEVLTPNDAYADLHRAKIYSAMGRKERAYKFLKLALDGSRGLDTMHHIEFRQDIRLDPAFNALRGEARWSKLLEAAYGSGAEELIRPQGTGRSERTRGRR